MRTGGRSKIKIFDDPLSLIHFLYALASVLLDIAIPSTIIYLVYQYFERESMTSKRGDLIEYAAGLFIGAAIRYWVRHL